MCQIKRERVFNKKYTLFVKAFKYIFINYISTIALQQKCSIFVNKTIITFNQDK